jgi:hypothetical protein
MGQLVPLRFGIVQMLQWLVWDPWWSLAVGGALVGYATDWLALKLMFEPVNPVALPFGFTLHGGAPAGYTLHPVVTTQSA